ncbi:MAG: class I SAM-dependent methyltransferase [Armatimonadota bacterium]
MENNIVPIEVDTKHVFPMQMVNKLSSPSRWVIHNPRVILDGLVQPEMTVVDFGCGPGFFTITMLNMVEKNGKVIAVDSQAEMLDLLKTRVNLVGFEDRVEYHQCDTGKIGINEKVDFILAFYVVHEVDNKDDFFAEAKSILKPNSYILIAEPRRRVSHSAFTETINSAVNAGFELICKPMILRSWTALLSA